MKPPQRKEIPLVPVLPAQVAEILRSGHVERIKKAFQERLAILKKGK